MTANSTDIDDPDNFGDSSVTPGDQPISTILTDSVIVIAPSTTLREAAGLLRREDVSLAVVGVGAAIDGVLSERDVVTAVAMGTDLDSTAVADVESHSLKWSIATASIDAVAIEMLETSVRHILVCHDDGTLAGIVSMRDLLAAYVM